jgi:exopolysaccharide biosynthesis polyprenyl glycosylphosphotransferase
MNLTNFHEIAGGAVTEARFAAKPLVEPSFIPTAPPMESRTNRRRRSNLHCWVFVAILGDVLMGLSGSILAFWLRFNSALKGMGHFSALELRQYDGHLILGAVTLIGALVWQDVYEHSRILQFRWVARRIVKTCLLWTLGFLAIALAFHIQPPISRIYMAINGCTTLALLLLWRRVYDALLRQPHRLVALQQRAIIVGWTADAEDLEQVLNEQSAGAYCVKGWVATTEDNALLPADLECLGHVDDLEGVLHHNDADLVILADLSGPRERALEIASLCEREMMDFKIIPACFRIFVSGLQLETVSGTPMLGVSRLPLDNSINYLLKRLVDIVGALVGLAISLPIMAVFGVIVYLESPGAVLYRQRRTGIVGRSFEIFKIRSMRLNAEEGTGAKWCTAADPRRLRIGAFMRKWNIDEVPQFWNVLRGEMSLVGPRPERPELIANFKHQIPHYNARHHGLPGMTGWAQVKGLRGDTDLSKRIRADIWYLENWSLLLDVQIMFLTFFKRANAY